MVNHNESREQLTAELASLRLRILQLEARESPAPREQTAGESVREAVLQTSPDGIFGVDGEGVITFFNHAASELTGCPVDDAVGRAARDVLVSLEPGIDDPVAGVLQHGATEHYDRLLFRRSDEVEVRLRMSIAPLREEGRISGAVATFHETTNASTAPAAVDEGAVPIDALLSMASAAASDGPFEERAEQVLDQLLTALGADRAVLLMTDGSLLRGDDSPATMMIEAPPGSPEPGPEPIALRQPKNDPLPSLGDAGVNSLAALPVKAFGRVVGMLSASSSKIDYFGAARIRLMTGALECLGTMAERCDLATRMSRKESALDTLYAVAGLLGGGGGFDETACQILQLAASAVGGTAALGVRDDSNSGVQWLAVAPTPQATEGAAYPTDLRGSIAGRALQYGTSVVLEDAGADPDPVVCAMHPDARSAAAIPLGRPESSDALMLVTSDAPNSFPEERMRLLAAIGQGLDAVLANARLGRDLNAGLEREYERLGAVQAAAAQLAIADSPDQALQHLVDAARDLVGAKYGGVAVWNLQGNVTTLVNSGLSETEDASSSDGTLRLTEVLGLVRFALVQERKRIIRVNESSTVAAGEASGAPPLSSLLGIPFAGKDGSIGTFFLVDKKSSGRFSPEDERLLGLFSAMASVVLDNLRLYTAAERQRRTLTDIQNSMAEGLVVLDPDGQVMFCNPAAEELLGTDEAQMKGKSLRALVLRNADDFDSPETAERLARALEQPAPSVLEVSRVRPRRRELALTLFPIDASATEQLTGLLVRDVTEERELERRRDMFVSVASHELRTPMTTVMGFTELLMSRDDPERRPGWLRHIYEDSKRVIRIVDDLLNVSRIQSGKIFLDIRPVDLKALLTDTAEKLRQTTSAHDLVVDVPDALPNASADPDKLGQVAVNLISNAIKYSPQGGRVTVSAWLDADGERLVMSVKDEGIGITKADQTQLFTTFQRIYRTETQGVRGTGLGLYIVKGLLQLMDGTVWVESELDQGSTFFVALPVARTSEPPEA